MSSGRTRAAAALAAACALAAGCAAERVAGFKAPVAAQAGAVAVTGTPTCPFAIASIDDRREDKSLGTVGATKIGGEAFDAWFASGLAAIPGHSSAGAPTRLRIEILKVYIQSLATLKSANLVVRVHATGEAGAPRVTTYRGVDGSINWNSSESEIQEGFDRALADLQRQISADLNRACKA